MLPGIVRKALAMSSAAICDTTLPRCTESREEQSRSFSSARLSRHLADARNVPRYVVRYGTVALAILGTIQLWAARGDGPIPTFAALPPAVELDPHRVSSGECLLKTKSDAERWQGLAPALTLLRHSNPEVADWANRLREQGKLVFTAPGANKDDRLGYLAKFDLFQRELRICPALFAEPDGSVAAILSHEYRHSRQGFPKVFSYALSFVFLKGGDPSIIENDAVIYEQEARRAIFGESNEPLDALAARLAAR